MKAAPALRNAAIALTVLYGIITIYKLSLNSDFFFCLFNPVGCATQSAVLQLLAVVEIIVNPLTIIVLAVLYVVAKRREK